MDEFKGEKLVVYEEPVSLGGHTTFCLWDGRCREIHYPYLTLSNHSYLPPLLSMNWCVVRTETLFMPQVVNE